MSGVLDPRGAGRRPVIGITAALKEVAGSTRQRASSRFVRADLDYVESVAGAGGAPVVLPLGRSGFGRLRLFSTAWTACY